MYKKKEYLNFLKSQNIIPSAFAIVTGSLITNLIKKIIDDVINPLSNGNKPIINLKEFGLEVINFILVTYILFIISDYLENNIF